MKSELLILTAPPASGKTFLISQIIKNSSLDIPLFISPLRALANECINQWKDTCVVMTPEEWLQKKVSHKIVIIDEFHLFFYWGDTFRPLMWEAFYGLLESAELVIVLTATLTPEMIEEVKSYSCHFDSLLWVDHGNQQLKHKPTRYLQAPDRHWLEQLILQSDNTSGVNLVFCAYRSEVLAWERRLAQQGRTVWTCLGGEAAAFSVKVQTEAPPEFIVATTVLSHGVNLPNISRIFFLYQIKNLDFWIQMVARGGRRGESFDVYALERPTGIKFNRLSNTLAIAGISLKMKLHLTLKQIEAWFLKA